MRIHLHKAYRCQRVWVCMHNFLHNNNINIFIFFYNAPFSKDLKHRPWLLHCQWEIIRSCFSPCHSVTRPSRGWDIIDILWLQYPLTASHFTPRYGEAGEEKYLTQRYYMLPVPVHKMKHLPWLNVPYNREILLKSEVV